MLSSPLQEAAISLSENTERTMRTSCNGCRVLRKGCNDDCTIRPCLQWIKSAECQANATVFLAKFYGRAGLLNLLNAGPEPHRPAIFKSLLYEACGRVVDPVNGSVGLMWSGQWHLCQAAVDAVLKGLPIMQPPPLDNHPTAPHLIVPQLKLSDINHVSSENLAPTSGLDSQKVTTRSGFKRVKSKPAAAGSEPNGTDEWTGHVEDEEDDEDESMFSVETVKASVAINSGPIVKMGESEIGLELKLGFENNCCSDVAIT
ncbi:LOB domain-containing protein 42 [Ancistrocladus abbreviatus]